MCSRRTHLLDRLHSQAFPRSNGSWHCEISMCNKGLSNIGLVRGASHFLPCASSFLSHLGPAPVCGAFFGRAFAPAWAELHPLVLAIQRPFRVEWNAIPDLLSRASGSNNARRNARSPFIILRHCMLFCLTILCRREISLTLSRCVCSKRDTLSGPPSPG
jgi:hypothetical protein